MTDIVSMLRMAAKFPEDLVSERLLIEGADEIKRLRAAIKTAENTARLNLKVAKDRGAEIDRLKSQMSPSGSEKNDGHAI